MVWCGVVWWQQQLQDSMLGSANIKTKMGSSFQGSEAESRRGISPPHPTTPNPSWILRSVTTYRQQTALTIVGNCE